MKKKSDILKAKSRRKLWDILGYKYKGKGLSYLSKRNSLNCGCPQCIGITKNRRSENKRFRKFNKEFMQNEIIDLISWQYYDYYDPSEVDSPTIEDLFTYGIPVFELEYFKYVA